MYAEPELYPSILDTERVTINTYVIFLLFLVSFKIE